MHPRYVSRLPLLVSRQPLRSAVRYFSASIRISKQLPPRPRVEEADIEEAFVKGSGPGGQKINKTSSAVQLKHVLTGIVVKCQATRSRSQNRKTARTLLAEKLEHIEKGSESRIAMRIDERAKKAANRRKKAKRKYGNPDDSRSTMPQDEEREGVEVEEEVGEERCKENGNRKLDD